MKTFYFSAMIMAIYYILATIMGDVQHLVAVHEKELMLQQMQIISTQCPSKSGSVDFETGDLKCDDKLPDAGSSARFKQMPNEI